MTSAASEETGTKQLSGTTAGVLIRTLMDGGVRDIFALPGIQNDELFDALHGANGLRTIHTRHEQGAAYMATGYAMATGRPGVYAVVPGPGFLNTTGALTTAFGCSAPVLALVGQIKSSMIGRGAGLLHEIPDQIGVMRQFTKWAGQVRSPADAAPMAAEALRQLAGAPFRPVGLECPMDVWGRRGVSVRPEPRNPDPTAIDPDAVLAAVKLLGAAKRPLIVVGAGALEAGEEVREIAHMLQAPVTANRMGSGVVSDRDPLSIDPVTGHILWGSADVVLAIGTRLQLQLMDWGNDPDLKVVRIDADATQIDRLAAPAVGLVGDARPILRALINSLPAYNSRRSRDEEIADARGCAQERLSVFGPQIAYLDAIRAELPDDGIFVDEMTQVAYVSRAAFPVYKPRTFLSPGYQGTLGWGMAAALGAQVARPGAKVVSVIGDGGFMFNVQELATAVQHGIPLVTILFNNGAYGNVQRIQDDVYGGRRIGSDLRNPDFVRLAECFGACAMRATTPEALRGSLRQAFKEAGPVLIEVPVGEMPDPWAVLHYRPSRPSRPV